MTDDRDIEKIRARHSDIPQDPLPGMPGTKAKKPRAVVSKPTWARIRQPKTKRPTMCEECSQRRAGGEDVKVLVAVWRRSINGERQEWCTAHADPHRTADGEKRIDDEREKRSWKKR